MSKIIYVLSLLALLIVGGSLTFSDVARATGPANCPTGQTALAQKYGTSQYCAMTVCKVEYKHADITVCVPCSGSDCLVHPLGTCFGPVKYEARPRFPQPPSPTGAWGNQPACPSNLDTATWY